MRSANKTVYVEPNYSQNRNQFQPYGKEMFQQSSLMQSRLTGERESQKTEQPVKKYVSGNAIKSINQQLYQIVNLDPRTAQSHLRKSAKNVYDLIDNELLLNIKHLSNMKLLMYDAILMYVEEFSQHQKDKHEWKQKQKALSNSIAKSVNSLQQYDVALDNYNLTINNKQLQNLKQTIPFVPKDKSKIPKTSRPELIQEELSTKIQSTKQSLQNILKKIEHYSNYRLSGEDIMRLKRSVVNVSQLKPSYFLNLQSMNTTQPSKNSSQLENSRPQSRQGKIRTQSSSKIRNDQKSRSYNGGFGVQQQSKSFSMNSKVLDLGSDDEGNKILIQQLQQIIERKQNRIKELTKELSKNLADQRQLEKTIQNFQVQIQQIQNQRKNFHFVIEKLQQQNLNYQLEIKQLKDSQILKNQVDNLSTSHQYDSPQYFMLKQFEIRQKIHKFTIRKECDVIIQSTPNAQSESTLKNLNSLSGAIAFNDISEITPKRLSKKNLLPVQIEQSYILESNVITTRKTVVSDAQSKQKRRDQSQSKYQMIGGSRTQMKTKKQTDSYSMVEMRDNQRQNYQKILFLQALTIQQMLNDI